tara:strand:+ start:2096 stop:3013 length:918 start_codon:yes stop_codon:yes gene_type:complete
LYNFKPWILASRPKTLFASISPVLIGLSISFYIFNDIEIIVGFVTLITAIMLQIGSNLANDAYDFLKGADNSIDRTGPPRMAQQGVLKVNLIINVMYTIFILCVIMGYYLALIGGWPIVIIGLASIFFAIIYTASRFALAYNGLGDLFVLLFFGLIPTAGTIYLQAQALNNIDLFFKNYFLILISSISIGAINTAILVINNLRDYSSDKKNSKNTLVVFFGTKFACYEYAFLLFINLVSVITIFIITKNFWCVPFVFLNTIISYNLINNIFNFENFDLNKLLEKTAKYAFLNALFFCFSVYLESL